MSTRQPRYPLYLINHIKKTVNLADFLENEIGCKLIWYDAGIAAGTICPMPNHKAENKPSFRIKFIEEDHLWIFNCFGCGVKGTIIDFCMDYYSFETLGETIEFLCKKFDIQASTELEKESGKEVKKTENILKKMEYANITSSNQCRLLLRKDYNRYNKWVAASYHRLNEALSIKDIDTVEEIGFEASNKIQEK